MGIHDWYIRGPLRIPEREGRTSGGRGKQWGVLIAKDACGERILRVKSARVTPPRTCGRAAERMRSGAMLLHRKTYCRCVSGHSGSIADLLPRLGPKSKIRN